MASTICGHCKYKTHLTPRWGGNVGEDSTLFQLAATCDNCASLNIAFTRGHSESRYAVEVATSTADRAVSKSTASGSVVKWFPLAGSAPDIENVPPLIADAAREAHVCGSIGAYAASILMARTVVEATAKAKGITSGSLVSKIDAMQAQNLIRPQIAEFAHEIRHLGNDMAHGDLEDAPTTADAADVLEIMSQVLTEVFQGPALFERLRTKRLRK